MNILVVTKRCHKVVKLEMGLHHGSLKVVEFIIELHHKSPVRSEVSVKALSYRLLYLCEHMNDWFCKMDY